MENNNNNLARWNWLVSNLIGRSPHVRNYIIGRYKERVDEKTREDIKLYEIMMELGLPLKGTDPDPPPPHLRMKDGAAEYDDILQSQEIYICTSHGKP